MTETSTSTNTNTNINTILTTNKNIPTNNQFSELNENNSSSPYSNDNDQSASLISQGPAIYKNENNENNENSDTSRININMNGIDENSSINNNSETTSLQRPLLVNNNNVNTLNQRNIGTNNSSYKNDNEQTPLTSGYYSDDSNRSNENLNTTVGIGNGNGNRNGNRNGNNMIMSMSDDGYDSSLESDDNSKMKIKRYSNCDYYIVWTCFFVMGMFNNFGYVIILSAAKSLADSFDESNLIGVESWALIGVGFIFKSINAFFLEDISHKIRILITSLGFFIGIFMLGFSVYIDFIFAIFSILFIGAACSFGESVILGYLKLFPSKVSGAFASGTGMAGLAGAGIYLLMSDILNFNNQTIFFSMLPTVICYLIAFFITWNKKGIRKIAVYNNNNNKNNNKSAHESNLQKYNDDTGASNYNNNNNNKRDTDGNRKQILLDREESDIDESQCETIIRCFKLVWYPCIMLCLVYLFEYVISVGLAQLSNTNKNTKIQDRDYVILYLCYQLGVFISRSSVSVIELPYFGIMTLLQGINFVVWHFHCQYLWFSEAVQFVLMVYVGLLGGAMYVNVVYWILSTNTVAKSDKELCINIMSIFVNIGITSSSIYELVMDNTFFHDLVKKSS